MKYKYLAVFVLTIVISSLSYGQREKAFDICPQKATDAARLACYDSFANGQLPPDEVSSVTDKIFDVERYPVTTSLLTYTPRELTSDGPNFFGMSSSPSFRKRGKRGEQSHLEFNVAIKYPLHINDESVRNGDNHGWPVIRPWQRLYFIYNGTYDFHALNNFSTFNREKVEWYRSAPVISRDQNPGFAAEWDLITDGTRKFRLGLMHHSNGQPKSYSDNYDVNDPVATAAALADKQQLIDEINGYINGPEGESYALQNISRASNYLQLRYQHVLGGEIEGQVGWKQYQLELRPYYFGVDDEVFWETGRREQPKITDYDGVRFIWEHYDPDSIFNFSNRLLDTRSTAFVKRVELKGGISGLKELGNVSTKVSLGWKLDNLVITGYWFEGWGKELASYHYRSQHWGVGLELR